jgi:hypothetical protein
VRTDGSDELKQAVDLLQNAAFDVVAANPHPQSVERLRAYLESLATLERNATDPDERAVIAMFVVGWLARVSALKAKPVGTIH